MPSHSASAIKAAITSGFHLLTVDFCRTLGIANGWAKSSCSFLIGGRRWKIIYYPNGNRAENSEFISIFIFLDDSSPQPARFQMMLTFEDEVRKRSQLHKSPVATISNGQGWGYPRFIRRDKLKKSKRLKKDGRFTIRCDISIIDSLIACEESAFVTVPPSELTSQIGDMLDTGKGGDVKFEVGGQIFTAHRCVLATRSPVFSAALYGPMKEGDGSGVIKINDIEPQIFEALLKYIYTDSLPLLEGMGGCAFAEHLLVASDRFGMERMKLLCEDKLCRFLEVANVATILILAEQHQCTGLKNACLDFLKRPGILKAVLATEEYNDLKRNFPLLADEVVDVLASQQ